MNIMWLVFKRLDRDLDMATWYEMTRELTKLGWVVELIFPKPFMKSYHTSGVGVTFLPVLRYRILFSISFAFMSLLYVSYRIIKNNPTIIILDDLGFVTMLPFLVLAKLKCIDAKFILDIRTIPVEVNDSLLKFKNILSYFVYTLARILSHGITVISSSMRKFIIEKFHIKHITVGIWTSGISLSVFHGPVKDISHKYPFNDKKFTVLYHGIITKSRGLFETIHAFSLLRAAYPDIRFVVLGAGNAKDQLELLVRHNSLQDTVVFLDPVPYDQIPDYINAANAGIIPLPDLIGWRVSSPLKLLEYLSMGRVVIVSDIEAHRDVIGQASYGIYIREVTPRGIADALIFAYSNRLRLPAFGEPAKEIISDKYSWQSQAYKFSQYLNSIKG